MPEFSADEVRKAADVVQWANDKLHYGTVACYGYRDLMDFADRLDAESAEKAKLNEQVDELARAMMVFPAVARAILTDGRWKRVDE